MVTYEQALKKAKKLKPNVDNCTECKDGYIFGSHADDMMIGGDGPVVITKKTGDAINFVSFITDPEYDSTKIREINIKKRAALKKKK